MSDRLSVIITTFNRPRLVQEAIESVLGQDAGPPFELVVVDDGSTGDTRDALQRFGRAIRYARQDNLGLNPARNHGLRIVQGDLVAILDDDDVWLPFKTRTLLPALRRYPQAGFVHSNFFVWKPDTNERRPDGLHRWFPRPFTWDEMYGERSDVSVPAAAPAGTGGADHEPRQVDAYLGDLYFWSLYAPMVLPSTAIVRRAALGGDTWFYDANQVGDWEFFARLSHRCGGVFVPIETTLNRSHEDTFRLTRVAKRIRLLERIGMLRRVWRTDEAFVAEHRGELDRIEGDCLRSLARASLVDGDVATAREALRTLRLLPGQARTGDGVLGAAAAIPGAPAVIGLLRRLRSFGPAHGPRRRGF